MIKMVAGLTSLLLMMPKLLAMIQDDKATRSSICKELAKLLGPQVYTVVQSALHRDDFKAFIKQALGPLAHTAIATIAMLALEMIFSYIQGELDWDEFTSVSSKIGVQTLLMCLSIAFPPAAYIPLLLSAASQLVAFCFPKFAEQVRVAIQKVIKFLGTALPLAQTAVGFALVAFGAYTPAMVFCVGYIGAAAGTGTAISTLSGAAATNAAMAWLGGGTVVAGGGGVAAGAAVMATVATGGLLIAAGGIAWLGYSFWEQDNAPSNVSEDLIDEGLIAK